MGLDEASREASIFKFAGDTLNKAKALVEKVNLAHVHLVRGRHLGYILEWRGIASRMGGIRVFKRAREI